MQLLWKFTRKAQRTLGRTLERTLAYTGTYTGVHWKNTYFFHSRAGPRTSAQDASGCAQAPPPRMRAGLHERRRGKLKPARAQYASRRAQTLPRPFHDGAQDGGMTLNAHAKIYTESQYKMSESPCTWSTLLTYMFIITHENVRATIYATLRRH